MLVSDQGAALLNQQVYSSGAPPPVGLNNEWMCSPAHCIGNSCGPICRGPRILASFPFIILLMLLLHCGIEPCSRPAAAISPLLRCLLPVSRTGVVVLLLVAVVVAAATAYEDCSPAISHLASFSHRLPPPILPATARPPPAK